MANKVPTVSVIIPTYNRAHLIGRAIQSVLSQTFQDFEIIVVDDGSEDNTKEVVRGFADGHVRYFRHNENRGGSAARNTGIRASRGEYIAFLDSDDEWNPRKLERQLRVLRAASSTVVLVFAGLRNVNSQGRELFRCCPSPGVVVDRSQLFTACFVSNSAILTRKTALVEVGGFDDRLSCWQDRDLWLRLFGRYQLVGIPDDLVVVHQYGDRISSNPRARSEGYALVLEKYGNEISKEPYLEAKIRTALATALIRVPEGRGVAVREFAKAVRLRPSLKGMLQLTAAIGGCRFYRTVDWAYSKCVRMGGGEGKWVRND